MTDQSITSLIEKLEGAGDYGDNALDVCIEVALFKPCEIYLSVRPNNAGTKLIYTDVDGLDATFIARGWSEKRNRDGTISLLRAQSEARV